MILRLIYSISLLFWGALSLPSMLKRAGARKKWLFFQKIGRLKISLPPAYSKRIWVHSVSLGETKAVEPLIKKLKEYDPQISIVCSHATLTGYDQSTKNPLVDFSLILPLDLPFMMKRLVKAINPDLFILTESDYWPSLLAQLRNQKVPISVVNGKLSAKTFNAYLKYPFLKQFTFELCHQILVQNEGYLQQFQNLGLKRPELISSGNLKFDIQRHYLSELELAAFAQEKRIPRDVPVVAFGCTHEKEEAIVLEQVELLIENSTAFVIIAPRHLERGGEIAKKLTSRNIELSFFSRPNPNARILLIDQIGVLDKIYQLANITVLCGSLVPGIGGHNLFEPLEAGTSLVYGLFVDKQKEMDDLIIQYESGLKMANEDLHFTLQTLLNSPEKRAQMQESSKQLIQDVKGSVEKTFRNIEKYIRR